MIPPVVLRAGLFGAAILAGGALCSPASAAGCEAWKGGSEIRCLSENPDRASSIAQTVHIQNLSPLPTTFRYEQWDSTCGFPGSSKGGPAEATLRPGDGVEIELQSAAFANFVGGARCTELFLFSCTAGGQGARCADALSTRMDPPRSGILGGGNPFGGLGR